jgi:hypothetical protein
MIRRFKKEDTGKIDRIEQAAAGFETRNSGSNSVAKRR